MQPIYQQSTAKSTTLHHLTYCSPRNTSPWPPPGQNKTRKVSVFHLFPNIRLEKCAYGRSTSKRTRKVWRVIICYNGHPEQSACGLHNAKQNRKVSVFHCCSHCLGGKGRVRPMHQQNTAQRMTPLFIIMSTEKQPPAATIKAKHSKKKCAPSLFTTFGQEKRLRRLVSKTKRKP